MGDCCLYTYFNDKYFEPGSSMIFSFVEQNKWFTEESNQIIILQDDKFCVLNEKNRGLLLKIYHNIVFQKVNMFDYEKIFNAYNWFNDNGEWKHNESGKGIERGDDAISAFYKYEIFKNCGAKHKVLLDADIIIRSSIKPLFETTTYFSCCPHESTSQTVKREKQYFNGGVYCVNDNIESEVNFEKIIEFSSKMTKNELEKNEFAVNNGRAVDQDYLNIYFCGKDVDLLPSSVYNCLVSYDISNAAVIHYYGPHNKPWEMIGQNIQRNRLGFLLYYEVTYWKNRLLSRIDNS